jgi:SAM-dependent methyltransferase
VSDSGQGLATRLFLLSFLMLFVELALIRWLGSNVVYLSYFSNFVLLGSFLGIGLGFLGAGTRRETFSWAPLALLLLVGFVFVFPVKIDRSGSALIYFGEFTATGLPTWVTLPVIFMAVAATMAMIADGVARSFARFEPLEAYRLDILGSIAGIVAFSISSFTHAPPVAWGVIVAALFAVLLSRRVLGLRALALVALVAILGWESLSPLDSWSPYYKVTVHPQQEAPPVYRVDVNGIPHQAIEPLEVRRQLEPIYFLAYDRANAAPDDVLVVGAGNGTDVAIALAQGATHVDAVEIDPRLYELGLELHPDRPYDDRRVSVSIDDARAFLERTHRLYDLILFALPDSLTLVSNQSSLRLESYLFTLEALREARRHLEPNGTFAMYNYFREQWLVDRLGGMLARAYGGPPCIDTVGEFGKLALFTVRRDGEAAECPTVWRPSARPAPAPVTDDYPFLYLRNRGVPGPYLLVLALILCASAVAIRATAGPLRAMAPYVDLFFMGAAFLLLETKSVVQFALLFGTTWFVNALVFTGILVCVLAAVEVARRVGLPRPGPLYALLFAALTVAWIVPPQALLSLVVPLRFTFAVLLAFTPVFAANLVFAQRFRNVGSSTAGFGANLLGAMFGGVLEYAALVIGYQLLLVVVALLYALAFVFGRGHLVTGSAEAAT